MDLGSILGGAGSALGGGLLGGALRLAPEVLKWLDRKDERKHELAMFDKQLAADAQHSHERLGEIAGLGQADVARGDIEGWVEAIKSQGVRTGVAWLDGLNSLVRPLLTLHWCVLLATVAMWAKWLLLTRAGAAPEAAIVQLWGPDEKAIVAAMLAFWFADRSLRVGGGVGAPH